MITDDQIIALAREYGEYVANRLDYDMCPDPELRHKLVVKGHSEAAQSVLEWLLCCYALVEKSKVADEYKRAIETNRKGRETGAHSLCTMGSARKVLLESLFPEIGKEVES